MERTDWVLFEHTIRHARRDAAERLDDARTLRAKFFWRRVLMRYDGALAANAQHFEKVH